MRVDGTVSRTSVGGFGGHEAQHRQGGCGILCTIARLAAIFCRQKNGTMIAWFEPVESLRIEGNFARTSTARDRLIRIAHGHCSR